MSDHPPKIPRRVVTGKRGGISTILEDRPVEHVLKNEAGFVISDPWATDGMPANLEKSAEIYDELFPKWHSNGTLFRYVSIPPDSQTRKFYPEIPGQPHPLMHQTETLDYIVILSGELFLVMEDCETLLKPGDIVIQCGAHHAWSNRTEKPCIQLAVLLDAQRDKNSKTISS